MLQPPSAPGPRRARYGKILRTLCCLLLKMRAALSRSPRGRAAGAYASPKANRRTLDFFLGNCDRPVRGGRMRKVAPGKEARSARAERDSNLSALDRAAHSWTYAFPPD